MLEFGMLWLEMVRLSSEPNIHLGDYKTFALENPEVTNALKNLANEIENDSWNLVVNEQRKSRKLSSSIPCEKKTNRADS